MPITSEEVPCLALDFWPDRSTNCPLDWDFDFLGFNLATMHNIVNSIPSYHGGAVRFKLDRPNVAGLAGFSEGFKS